MSENLKNDIEEMGEFFNKRAENYEDHMRETVESFENYYNSISNPIVQTNEQIKILDLGCGTGLELEGIFSKAPNCQLTGIDMSEDMMVKLKKKYQHKLQNIKLKKGSYLIIPFSKKNYDYVVSSMTMHHFVTAVKLELYKKIRESLKKGGKYIEGDYMVTIEKEKKYLDRYYDIMNVLIEEEKSLYHIDIPLAIETQKELLRKAGFKKIEIIWHVENKLIMVAEA